MGRDGTHTKTIRKRNNTHRDPWLCPAAIPDYPVALQPTGLSVVTEQKGQSLKTVEVNSHVRGKWGRRERKMGEDSEENRERTLLDCLKPDMNKILRNYSVGRAVFLRFASSIPVFFRYQKAPLFNPTPDLSYQEEPESLEWEINEKRLFWEAVLPVCSLQQFLHYQLKRGG